LKINGHEITEFSDVSREVLMAADHQLVVDVSRDGKTLTFATEATELEDNSLNAQNSKRYMLGVKSVSSVEMSYEDLSLGQAFVEAIREVWNVTNTTLRGVGQMLTGKRSGEDVGGIIRIAEMSGDISKNEGFLDFVTFLALLSINLGLINLFPIPVLDGGHVVIFLLEIITGREIKEKVKEYLFKAGLALLIALMIYATKNDIVHLIDRLFHS